MQARGFVVGDVLRRWVALTSAQQLGPQVESATAPFEYALSTRGGCECVAVIQGLSELNPDSTVMSIALVTRFRGRRCWTGYDTDCRGAAIPFGRMLYGSPSPYVWEAAEGVEHFYSARRRWRAVGQSVLLTCCQHRALEATQEEACRRGEFGRVPRRHLGCVARPRHGSVTCIGLCSAICFPTPGFVSTVARRRFGTGAESDLRDVMRSGRGWQVVGGDAHIHLSVGEGKSSTRTTSPAEEGRAGLEDEVESSLAQLRRQSQHVSWASGARMGLTETLLSVGRWRRTTATPSWLCESVSREAAQ